MSNTILRTDSLTLNNLSNTAYLSADYVYVRDGIVTNTLSAHENIVTNTLSSINNIDLMGSDLLNISDIINDTDTLTISSNVKITNDHLLILPSSSNPAAADEGAIRYNDDTSSFEGYSDGEWMGLGGLTRLDESGNIDGTNKAYIGEIAPGASITLSVFDMWYDTTNKIIKYYDGVDWIPFGAVYK